MSSSKEPAIEVVYRKYNTLNSDRPAIVTNQHKISSNQGWSYYHPNYEQEDSSMVLGLPSYNIVKQSRSSKQDLLDSHKAIETPNRR
jgi:hypothetical protein